MKNIITYENLSSFASSNDRIIEGGIKGIVLSFFGLGCQSMFDDITEEGKFYASRGIVFIIPYTNPWAWMNRQAIDLTDDIVTIIKEKYALEDIPVVSTGGSMGGMSALVYTKYSRHCPSACVANCPVCDLPYHYTERPDLPRTLYSAFASEDGELREVLERYSPLHLANSMPDVDYHIFHCECDHDVSLSDHSEKFVAKMKASGKRITFEKVPDRGHCDLSEDALKRYTERILSAIPEC